MRILREFAPSFGIALLTLAFGALPLPALSDAAPIGTTPGRHSLRGDRVHVSNVIGSMKVVPTDGSDVVVEITPVGKDGSKLRVVTEECRGVKWLRVVYPSDRVAGQDIGYFSARSVWMDGCDKGYRIHFTRPGDGIDARADLVVRVPRDQKIEVELGAGRIEAADVRADLLLDAGCGDIAVRHVEGRLHAESGSGSVTIDGATGSVEAETGSGSIDARHVDGALSLESGSGGISLGAIRAREVSIECGSGEIRADNVISEIVRAECGSGGIELSRVNAPRVAVETGSGRTSIDLARSPESLRVDSGSGGVTITTPKELSARLQIQCSKRLLDLDIPLVIDWQDDDELRGHAGDGKGSIAIETGSGRVSMRVREN